MIEYLSISVMVAFYTWSNMPSDVEKDIGHWLYIIFAGLLWWVVLLYKIYKSFDH